MKTKAKKSAARKQTDYRQINIKLDGPARAALKRIVGEGNKSARLRGLIMEADAFLLKGMEKKAARFVKGLDRRKKTPGEKAVKIA